MLAISTSWNAWRHSRAEDIIKEITSLRFNRIELSFNLSATLVKQMLAQKRQGHWKVQVVSVHNFCPLPEGVPVQQASPDIFSLSAVDEGIRQRGVHYTKKTIDTASEFGAQAVVLHLGRVQMPQRLRDLAKVLLSQKDEEGCQRLKAQMLKERKAKSERFFAQTLKSLKQLCSYAQEKKIKLGIENRYYFAEIPSVEEMSVILARFSSPPLYYWHDVGHAQVYEELKFLRHKAILDKFSQRMLGIHLHDIAGINDHRAPLKGNFDFKQLRPYLKKDTLKVIEAHHPATAKEITQAKRYLEKLLG